MSLISPRRAAVLAAVVVSLLPAGLAFGQGGPPPYQGQPQYREPSQPFRVIDVGKIMKSHVRLNQALDQWKSDFTAEDKRLLDRVHEIQNAQNRLKELKADSAEYKQGFAQVTKMEGDLNVDKSLRQKEFSERRAKLFFTAYREIQQSVKDYCQFKNVAMVIQYESAPINGDNPQEIAQGMSRGVLFVDPGLDITDAILADLNRSSVSTAPQGVGVPQQR